MLENTAIRENRNEKLSKFQIFEKCISHIENNAYQKMPSKNIMLLDKRS